MQATHESARRGESLLRAENLSVRYQLGGGRFVDAVAGVSFDLARGETLGLAGESGCGKSTTARAVIHAPGPTGGRVVFNGQDLSTLDREALRRIRPRLQLIYQDPIASLNPRRRISDIIAEGLRIWDRDGDTDGRVRQVMQQVGLDPGMARRRPREFSGGQCQRVSIARALVLDPDVLVCDEPVSALDVSVQAQILNLLRDLRRHRELSMIFIAHDLAVVKNICDRVAVMYLGKLCEIAPVDALFDHPAHPYTMVLLDAVPDLDPRHRPTAAALSGDVPSPLNPPIGCRFHSRCEHATEVCRTDEPQMRPLGGGHFVACHHADVPATVPVAMSRSGRRSDLEPEPDTGDTE